ncbi:hypothetical protein RHS04_00888 [Rhizoctonia solani]|uniref:Serine-threonine/tyrosine-protein kinase catalytic domain-containing protein n=1 Tax=Rhizoctonia solani TaxID=456999 RepID=A0A8H7HGZ0_9AGAM|nr:hypothetical protein RHS04_00888 [Rhizoctonia solani]
MSGKLPYFPYQHDLRVRHEITSKTLAGHRDNLLSPDFVEIWGLVTSCWEWAADQRPSVTELAQSISKTMIGLGSPDLSTMDVHNSEQIKVIINIPSRSSQTDQGSGHNSAVTFESHYRYTPYEKITGKTAADILKEVDQTPQSSNTVLECHRDYLPLYGGPKNPGALWSAPVLGASSLGSDGSGLLGEHLGALHEHFRASYQTLRNAGRQ